MKSIHKVLAIAAISMTALVGLSANATQAWSGEQPVFNDITYASTPAVNASEVQAQARQAIKSHAFNDQMTSNLQQAHNSQAAPLSRAQVQAEAAEAVRNNSIQVGE